ncbi:MAG: ABC transporter permease [Gammaproteobacteria bacterium]|nr:ABC transporter permease [Gammaproteobacteria bacterium]MBU2180570.1 ABC transporter permease [Gammaproteobacteria bacterium]MBU2225281.1 ABC transporter permease [Gammaproteobacteria bacterium]MBU2428932.1 ABC transporter permease [Gammaproteobacteria bacterium]
MFSYYLRLAWLSIRQSYGLSLLMVLAIGLGIGAAMTTVTVNYLMSANPIPTKSEQLFYVQLDSWDPHQPANDNGDPPDQLTYRDATALLSAKKAYRQVVQAQMSTVVEPQGKDSLPFQVSGRANSADFFAMFEVPFLYGGGWDQAADDSLQHVVVLSQALNERLFGGKDSVGEKVKLAGDYYQVVGVVAHWQPRPRFYDVTTGAFNDVEELFVPFSLLTQEKIGRNGNTNCWKPSGEGFQAFLNSECVWTQFWAELRTEDEKQDYLTFLNAYTSEQKKLGRFERPLNNRLSDVMQWMENQQVVAQDASLMMVMSLMFLIVCLLNTIGLLLAKFLSKAPQIGLRQALGASRRDLFAQYLTEAGCIGIAGGLLGLVMAWLGLQGIQLLYGDEMKGLAQLDIAMVALAMLLALVSSLLAGLYPTWRACTVQPSQQLKSQ